MDFFRSHKLISATIIIQIIAIPLILLLVQQKQDTRTHAAASSTLYFNPSSSSSSPIQGTIGQNMALDLNVDPGTNQVSFAKVEIDYDPTLFTPDPTNPVVVNSQAYLEVLEGPVLTTGKIEIAISIGANTQHVIQSPTKLLTVNLKPIASSNNQNTSITIGPDTELRSLTDGNDNVYSSGNPIPAIVRVAAAPTPTANPTPTPSATPIPPSPTSTPKPTATPTPKPTSTPIPTPTPLPPTPTIGQTNTTATPTPGTTKLSFIGLKLHGLGKGGDNPNPNSIGTLNPLRPTRAITVTLINNSLVPQNLTGNITYTGPTTGLFNGDVIVPNSIADGSYTVKLSTPYYVTQQLQGFITLNAQTRGTSISMITSQNPVALVAGDVNQDGSLQADLDYNIIMECYSDLQAAKSTCTPAKKAAADISDDGNVNMDDYNLFLRELSVQKGD